MLWVVFNKNGQFISSYNVGGLPFAGGNEFSIFAIFKELNVAEDGDYTGGSIKLYKPDLEQTSYVPFNMVVQENVVFDGETNANLVNGQAYNGVYFDFEQQDADNPLLDTAGLWRAVITLFNPVNANIRKVIGSVTFDVGNGIESADGNEADIEDLLERIYQLVDGKLDKNSAHYLKVIDTNDIDSYEFGAVYKVGDLVVNKGDNNSVYKLDENKEPVLTDLTLKELFLDILHVGSDYKIYEDNGDVLHITDDSSVDIQLRQGTHTIEISADNLTWNGEAIDRDSAVFFEESETSGSLSDPDIAKLSRNNAIAVSVQRVAQGSIIIYRYYVKSSTSGGVTIVFNKEYDVSHYGTYSALEQKYIACRIDTKTWNRGSFANYFYDKAQTDRQFYNKSETYSADAIDTMLQGIKTNAFQLVDYNRYPTLQLFLDNYQNPEEGVIYLYPINKLDLREGYYQYICENPTQRTWISLGTTNINVDDYVNLYGSQTITGEKTFDANVFIPNSHNIIGDTNFYTDQGIINASIFMGYNNHKNNAMARSLVVGSGNNFSNTVHELFNITCFADNSTVTQNNSLTTGYGNLNEIEGGTVLGVNLQANYGHQKGSMVIGQNNSNVNDALFQIGDGASTESRHNALSVENSGIWLGIDNINKWFSSANLATLADNLSGNKYVTTDNYQLINGEKRFNHLSVTSHYANLDIEAGGDDDEVINASANGTNLLTFHLENGQTPYVGVPTMGTADDAVVNKAYADAIREVAEGKCKTVVISYEEELIEENDYGVSPDSFYYTPDGTKLETWSDFLSFVGAQSSAAAINSFANALFDSDNQVVDVGQKYIITDEAFQKVYRFGDNLNPSDFKIGDIILVEETNVPDRWFDSNGYVYKLETSKVDLNNVYKKNESLIPTSSETYNIGEQAHTFNRLYLASSLYFYDGHEQNGGNISLGYPSGDPVLTVESDMDLFLSAGTDIYANANFLPDTPNSYDIGSSTKKWKDAYFSGKVNFYYGSGSNVWWVRNGNQELNIGTDANSTKVVITTSSTSFNTKLLPWSSATYDLGGSSFRWKDIWVNNLKGIATLTQAQYDALVSAGTVDPDTFYFIEEE